MKDKELSALKALAEAATPGPWFVQHGDDYNFMNMTAISTEDRGHGHLGELTGDSLLAVTFHQSQPWVACELDDLGDANRSYIAAANPTAILSLISRVEQAEREHDELKADKEGGRKAAIGAAKPAHGMEIPPAGLDKHEKRIWTLGYQAALATSPAPSEQEQGDPVASEKEALRLLAVQSMADCMDMVRNELIEMGIIEKRVPPMFIPEAIANYIKRYAAPSASQGEVKVPDAAFELSGNVCEIGQLEDEGGEHGFILKRGKGKFVTVKGLEIDEIKALGPCFMKPVTISFCVAPAPSQTCNGKGLVGGRSGQTPESYEEYTAGCDDCDGQGKIMVSRSDLAATTTPANAAAANGDGLAEAKRTAVRDAIAEALGDAYDCMRVWSAWSYGKMGPDDFSLVAEDDSRLDEITDAALRAMAAADADGQKREAA